eukprot:3449459-Rhodomonas_salina.2
MKTTPTKKHGNTPWQANDHYDVPPKIAQKVIANTGLYEKHLLCDCVKLDVKVQGGCAPPGLGTHHARDHGSRNRL